MHIIEAFYPLDVFRAMFISAVALMLLKRTGVIHSYLHPMTPAYFQVTFTLGLLAITDLPFGHVVSILVFFLIVQQVLTKFAARMNSMANSAKNTASWERAIPYIIALSVAVNAYLAYNKGLLIFAEEGVKARQEFYQGWGIFQRLNVVFSVVLAAHWARAFVQGNGLKPTNILLLFWTCFVILSLGSKAGLLALLTSVGAAMYFSSFRISIGRISAITLVGAASVFAMFYAIFGIDYVDQFTLRFMAFADGPFYYFNFENPIRVSFSYPIQQLLVALRIQPALAEPSLGPAINLVQFNFNSDIYGPNPQIYVDSTALFGSLYFFYYVILALVISTIIRSVRSVYDLCLYATVAAPMLVDIQLAFSNVFNLGLALFLKLAFGDRFFLQHFPAEKIDAHYISRV
ncbi:hypothetical protein WAB17_06430 [Parerythrobacter aurantius]|uniref:hypothetical protein n=1 Tax=Parerythrobacter aurantius TaxID=3127706 RepID=UPI00324ED16C